MTAQATRVPLQASTAPKTAAKVGGLAACVGLACATILTPLVQSFEGKRNVGYLDIVKVATACYGQTGAGVKVGQRYTDAQCDAMLESALVAHAAPVLVCTPTLKDHPTQLAAAVSLAYNIGTGAYCASTVDKRFDAGNWRGACDAMLMWNKAGGRVVAGLTNRRTAERALCLKELPK